VRRRANSAFSAASAVAVALALSGCGADGDRPGMQVLPGMVDSGTVHAFDESPVHAGSPALALPPAGTMPRDGQLFTYGTGPAEAQRAGRELVNPFPPTDANLARGKQVFENVCIVCHGPRGEGDGAIIGRFPNPPSLLAAHARALPDGQLFHVILRGQGIMPSHAAQVLPDDRWKVILHVRWLQAGAPAASTAPAAAVAAMPSAPKEAKR
jgi:mono/diheme cytochrome c family protein